MRLFLVLCVLLALPPPRSPPAPPAATTGAASGVTRTTATLNGTVDPNGTATSYHFEYGTTTAYGLASAGGDAGDGDAAGPVAAGLEGLSAGTTYHYRLVAANADGAARAPTARSARPPAPRCRASRRTVAREVGPTGATLRSRIDPNRGTTTLPLRVRPLVELRLAHARARPRRRRRAPWA